MLLAFFSLQHSFCFLPYSFFEVAQRLAPAPSKRGDNFRTAHFRRGHAAKAGVQQEPADALHLRERTLARMPIPADGTTTSGRTAL